MANKFNIYLLKKYVNELFLLQNRSVVAASNEPGKFSHSHFNVYWLGDGLIGKRIVIQNWLLNVDFSIPIPQPRNDCVQRRQVNCCVCDLFNACNKKIRREDRNLSPQQKWVCRDIHFCCWLAAYMKRRQFQSISAFCLAVVLTSQSFSASFEQCSYQLNIS